MMMMTTTIVMMIILTMATTIVMMTMMWNTSYNQNVSLRIYSFTFSHSVYCEIVFLGLFIFEMGELELYNFIGKIKIEYFRE